MAKARRRTFSNAIIQSLEFQSLSYPAQVLYINLNFEADDDGLLNNAIAVTRYCGIQKKALNELYAKRFLLDLGNDVTCIKHWLIHNTIKNDRYKPSRFEKERGMLAVREDRAYTEKNKK